MWGAILRLEELYLPGILQQQREYRPNLEYGVQAIDLY
jgi:hypothetical protein